MKLLNKAFDRAVELSQPVKELADAIKKLTEQTYKLATNVAALAHNQQIHAMAINQISATQRAVYNKLNENSLDTSMPDIDVTGVVEQSAEGEPVSRKKTVNNKPN